MPYLFQILLISLAIFNVKPLLAQEVSGDCKHWTSVDPKSPLDIGCIKSQAGIIYADLSKKIWISLAQRPMVFVLKESEVLILNPQTVEAVPYTSKHPDKIVELMLVISELGKKMLEESRWAFRLKNGEAMLVGLLARNKSCQAVPNAKAIMCRKNRPCSVVPPLKGANGLAFSCAKELGLLKSKSIERLNRPAPSLVMAGPMRAFYKSIQKPKLHVE